MIKKYLLKNLLIAFCLLLIVSSCKKDNKVNSNQPTTATPKQLGLYKAASSSNNAFLLLMAISKIGTSTVNYGLIFDTGSGGLVIDASGIVPASMITTNGFNFSGASTVVNGITITNQSSSIQYGADNNTTVTVYGNLAYAPVTIGDANGNIVVQNLPFFLYYKAVDGNNNVQAAHDFDVFGVSTESDLTFSNNVSLQSPLSFYDPGAGLTKGFKLAALGQFTDSNSGIYTPGLLTLGLTPSDLSPSSGFVISQLSSQVGYAPIIPATINYNNKNVSTDVIFDTGTEPYSYLQDPTFNGNPTLLPSNTTVNITAPIGFSYQYTTTNTSNLTYVENPNTSGGRVSIISLSYFINNEYLLDYTDNKLGLKLN